MEYTFTATDHFIIKNTPNDRFKFGICNKHGVFANKQDQDELECMYCDEPGTPLDLEKYKQGIA